MMTFLEKIRYIFASNETYNKRDRSDLMGNAPWMGNYDRTNIPKDMHGGVTKEAYKNEKTSH